MKRRDLTDKEIAKLVAGGAVAKVRVAPHTYLQVRYPGKAYWGHCFQMPTQKGEPKPTPIMHSLGPWEPHHRVADFSRLCAARHEMVRNNVKPQSPMETRRMTKGTA